MPKKPDLLKQVFNELRLDLYDFSIANGSIGPNEQRKIAEQMAANLTKAERRLRGLLIMKNSQ